MQRILTGIISLSLAVTACGQSDSDVSSSSDNIEEFDNPRGDGAFPEPTVMTEKCRDDVVMLLTTLVTEKADASFPDVRVFDPNLPRDARNGVDAYLHYYPKAERVSVTLRTDDDLRAVVLVEDATATGTRQPGTFVFAEGSPGLRLAVIGDETVAFMVAQDWFCPDADEAPAAPELDNECVGLMARSLPSPSDYMLEDGVINDVNIEQADATLAAHADARVRQLALPVFRDFADAVLRYNDELRLSLGAWKGIDGRDSVWLGVDYTDANTGHSYRTSFGVTELNGKAYATVQYEGGYVPKQYICETAAAAGN